MLYVHVYIIRDSLMCKLYRTFIIVSKKEIILDYKIHAREPGTGTHL